MATSKRLWIAGTLALMGVGLLAVGRQKPVSRERARAAASEPAAVEARAKAGKLAAPVRAPKPTSTQAPATAPASRAVRGAPAEKVFTAKWGGSPGELGRKEASESSPEGPMSFVVDDRGRAVVLDQVNSRVQVFEAGRPPRSVQLPGETFQDVALTKNDGLVVLDRLTTGSLAFVDSTGTVTHEVELAGKGVPEPGEVTGLFQRDDGTWVEVGHANLVRVADGAQNADLERPMLQGRPTSDGAGILRASKSGTNAAYVAHKRGDEPARALCRVEFELPVHQLLALETDAHGRIFLGASLLEERSEPPFDVLRTAEQVVVLSPNGAELTRIELPETHGADESFRRIRIGGDGFLYQLTTAVEGATMWRVKP